jgi:hypothetical protein
MYCHVLSIKLSIVIMDTFIKAQMFAIQQILENKCECTASTHELFIDFKKTYVSVQGEDLYNILITFGICKPFFYRISNKVCMCVTVVF